MKKIFKEVGLWIMAFVLATLFGAMWAAATGWPPVMNIVMVLYLTAVTGRIAWAGFRLVRPPSTGNHVNNGA